MPTQQLDLFDIIVNVVPGLTSIALILTFSPVNLLQFAPLNFQFIGVGIGVFAVVASYLLGEFIFGLARQDIINDIYTYCEKLTTIIPIIGLTETDFKRKQTMQEYIRLALSNGDVPSINQSSVRETLQLAESHYNMKFLNDTGDGNYKSRNLDQLYYLTRSELSNDDVLSIRFETESNLFLNLWLTFLLASVYYTSMFTLYIFVPEFVYIPIWISVFGDSLLPNYGYSILLTIAAGFCIVRRHKYREKQVKTMIYDLYVHLNTQEQ